jgi:asparagine synthase (glutamine-hydrolysing)
MQHAKVKDYIHESRKKLVEAGILKQDLLQKAIRPQSAHEPDNFDWRYLCAAQCL